ncbi:MAG: hypothetical protein JST17_02165 [Bacteroidetes bacterium]|nr:hypothetical protein [Bacteroidota bacterium]MBS1931368.1 hypothetical protein [Bacteroidota bacterium]
MAGGPPGSSGNHPLKNIAIGVATTVLASSIVYFLGFHGDHADTEEVRVRKEATVEAWSSLMFYEKQFGEAGTRMVCKGDTTGMADDVLNEYDKIIKNISNIEKVDHVDNRLLSLIDRRLATLSDKRKATSDYYRNVEALGSGTTEDPKVMAEYQKFISKINTLDTQDTSFINGVSTELNKKYSVKFNLPGPFIVTPEILYGDWTVDRNKFLNLKKDNTFSFEMESKNYPGKWTLDYLTIHFNFDDGSSIDYTINSGNPGFMLANDTNGNPHFLCR